MKKACKIMGCLLLIPVVIIGIYAAYVFLSWHRIVETTGGLYGFHIGVRKTPCTVGKVQGVNERKDLRLDFRCWVSYNFEKN